MFKKDDPRINRKGRPRNEDRKEKPTNRELKERELIMLLRKIKPHVAEAINAAVLIMGDEKAAHQNQLKAATILLDNYRRLVLDVYEGEDKENEAGTEIQQQNAPVFSLKVVNGDDPA